MSQHHQELEDIHNILTKHPKGLTIAEISSLLHLNRISTSKYLNMLRASGMAEMRVHGPSKVFYPSQRVPISSILNFTTSLLLVMDDTLSIVDTNNALLEFFSVQRSDVIGHRIEYSPIGGYITPNLMQRMKQALDSIESSAEVQWIIKGESNYLVIKITPTLFENGCPGVTLIADDVTELTRYRLNLEQLVEERSDELNRINTLLTREIEKYKTARKKLLKSEQKYRELVENANSLIIRFDRSGKITYVNEYAESFLGYSEAELLSQNIYEALVPRIASSHGDETDTLTNLLAFPEKYEINICEISKKDKTRAWVSFTNRFMKNAKGDIISILVIGNDITEFKRIEQALQRSEQRYKTLYCDNPSMFITLDQNGIIISMNRIGAKRLGFIPEELKGTFIFDLIYEEDRVLFRTHLQMCIHDPGTLYQWQFRKLAKDGSIVWVKVDARAGLGMTGIIEVFIVSQDISDLKENEEKLQAIINFLPDPTFVVNGHGQVTAWNKAIEELTGVPSQEVIGKGDLVYSLALYQKRRPVLVDYVLNHEEELPSNYRKLEQKGLEVFAESCQGRMDSYKEYFWGKAAPLYDSAGRCIGAIETIRHITDKGDTKGE